MAQLEGVKPQGDDAGEMVAYRVSSSFSCTNRKKSTAYNGTE